LTISQQRRYQKNRSPVVVSGIDGDVVVVVVERVHVVVGVVVVVVVAGLVVVGEVHQPGGHRRGVVNFLNSVLVLAQKQMTTEIKFDINTSSVAGPDHP